MCVRAKSKTINEKKCFCDAVVLFGGGGGGVLYPFKC